MHMSYKLGNIIVKKISSDINLHPYFKLLIAINSDDSESIQCHMKVCQCAIGLKT